MRRLKTKYRIVVQDRNVVLADRRNRYWDMFDPIFKKAVESGPRQKDLRFAINHEIEHAMASFKREDRILWYLRLYRDMLKEPNGSPEKYTAKQIFERAGQDLDHYLANALINGYESVLDYRIPPNATVKEVADKLRSLERADLAKASQTTRYVPIEPKFPALIKFQNGWEWQVIDTGKCEKEGKAMRHCGNTANWREGDEILSLREPVKFKGKPYWKPQATFIWNDGYLGEMKGYANEKPGKNLYPYIIKLLENDKVSGIRKPKGSHARHQDFKLSDLGPEEVDKLLKEKPELADVKTLYEMFGLENETVRGWVESLDGGGVVDIGGTHYWKFKKFLNTVDLAEDLDRDLHRVMTMIDDNDALYDFGSMPSTGDLSSLLSDIESKNKPLFKKIVEKVKEDPEWKSFLKENDIGLAEFKKNPERYIIEMLEAELLDWLSGNLMRAYEYGRESGINSAAYKDCMEYMDEALNEGGFTVLKESGSIVSEMIDMAWDEKFWLAVPLSDVFANEDHIDYNGATGYYQDVLDNARPRKFDLGDISDKFDEKSAISEFEEVASL